MSGEPLTPDRVQAARASARAVQDRLSEVSADIAATAEGAADVYDALAQTRPQEAARYTEHAEHARAFAEHEREYARSHAVEPPDGT